MTLRRGRRTVELTRLRREPSLALARLAVAAPFGAVGAALGLALGGWAWAATALLAIPAASTLRAALTPYAGECPACGSSLRRRVVALPDEPVLAPSARDLRCDACGVYLDAKSGDLREVPFDRVAERPTYRAALDEVALADLDWGARCVACDAEATRRLTLAPLRVGLLAGPEATLGGIDDAGVPFCDAHGEWPDRGVEVTRAQGRATVAFAGYAGYRAFVDANRERLDITVRAADDAEG